MSKHTRTPVALASRRPNHDRRARFAAALEGLEPRRLLSAVVVGITASDASAGEAAAATGKFHLVRDATVGALTVNLAISGTATNGIDYTTIPATATFAAGVGVADVTVTPKEDAGFEGSETVIVTLSESDTYDIDADADAATVTIADNDKPVVSVTATDATALEGDEDDATPGTFTLTRTGITDDALAVKVAFSGTAGNGTDYVTIATTVTIPADEESVEVTLTPSDDSTLEGDEKAILTLASDAAYTVASGAGATATVTISDDELPTLTLSVPDATATEGSATDTGKFTITRNGPTTASLDVNFAVSGVAASGTDFDSMGTTVTIPAGKASVDVILKTKQDTTVEGPETATLTLSSKATYTLDNAHKAGSVTVTDDDKPVVSIAATDATAYETGTNTNAYFTVTRTGATGSALTVPVVIGGTASKGSDYKSFAATVTIPAGKTSARIKVKAKDDELLEGKETLLLTLGTSADFLADAAAKAATVTLNDDELPEVSIAATDAVATEPTSDKGLFTVTRTGPTTDALTVTFVVGGTGTNGTDVETVATSVVIPAGKSSATIAINPKDDTTLEGTETIVLTIADSANYDTDVNDGAATLSIVDNEKATVSLTATDASAAEQSSATGKFTLTRDGPTTEELKVSVTIAGTATKGTDYAAFDGTITIPAGASTKVVTVTPIDDTGVEDNETVILTLASGATYNVGTDKTATVNIAENDMPTVGIVATDAAAAEPTDKGTFTLTRNGPTTAALTVDYVVSGSANSDDYAALSGSAIIPAGKASVTVDVATKEDTALEGKETVILTLAEDDAYAIDGAKDDAKVEITDNEKPVVNIVATDATADEGDTDETAVFTFTRTGPTTDALDVTYTTAGTAVTGTDTTTALSGTVRIAAGQASKTITLTGKDDGDFEGAETVILAIKPTPAAYTIEDAKKAATATLADDDKPTVSVVATKASAKESAKETLVYTFTRTGNPAAALTVAFDISGTATEADAAAAVPATVTIPAGKLFSTVTITVKDDATYEGPETATLTIDDSAEDVAYAADNAADHATGTIVDNELPTITIVATDTTAAEKDAATGVFIVSRGVAAAEDVTVNLALSGTAKNGKDYIKIGKTITIPAGSISYTFTLRPKTDSTVEGPETVVIGLATGSTYAITSDNAKKSATVTIDDEQTPTVSVAANDASVDEDDGEGTWYRISRNGRTLSASLVVQLAITGTADEGSYAIEDEDGNEITNSVTLAAGEAYVDVYVRPVDNNATGSDTTVILTIAEDDAYEIDGSADDATVTIADDD